MPARFRFRPTRSLSQDVTVFQKQFLPVYRNHQYRQLYTFHHLTFQHINAFRAAFLRRLTLELISFIFLLHSATLTSIILLRHAHYKCYDDWLYMGPWIAYRRYDEYDVEQLLLCY